MADLNKLPPRERQIMDFLIASGGGTVNDVVDGIDDPPSYSAVRAMLAKLERKGYIAHEEVDRAYRYKPLARERASRSAIQNLLDTFFGGSTEKAVSALLKSDDLTDEELDRLAELVAKARRGASS
jgi:BlaI family transcriptional regulator, penicillinase repressor